MTPYFSKYQWKFWKGHSNDFDILRIGFDWKDWRTAKLVIVVFGFELVVPFRAYSVGTVRRWLTKKWSEVAVKWKMNIHG